MTARHRFGERGQAAGRRTLLLLAALLGVLLPSACSTGGGQRGNVSDTAAQAAHDGDPGRGTGRTRTKTDHNDQPTEPDDAVTESEEAEEGDDDGSSFLADLLIRLFARDDDVGHPPDSERSTAGPPPPPSRYSEIGALAESDEDPHRTGAPSGDSTGHSHDNLIVWLSQAGLAGDTVARVACVSIMYSTTLNRRWRGHLGLFHGKNRKGSQELVQDGITEIREYGVDLGVREYLRPNDTLTGLYLLCGLRAGAMRWTYAWADPVPEEGRVAGDGVYVFTPYLGIGASVVNFKSVHLGASVSWGQRFMVAETFQNANNDLFLDVGELRLNIETSFFF